MRRQLQPGGTRPRPSEIQFQIDVRPDARVLGFTLLASVVTTFLFALAPALRATSIDTSSALKETSRSSTGSRTRLSTALLVAQVALSLVLLIGAGLFLNTLWNLRRVDVGFDTSNLMMFRVNPQLTRYDNRRTMALYGGLLERIARVPGVKNVSASQPPLLSGALSGTDIFMSRSWRTKKSRPRRPRAQPRKMSLEDCMSRWPMTTRCPWLS